MDLRILLAPDKFKGTLDATAVAAAMAAGVRDFLPTAEVRVHPLADGGEGTLDCLASSLPGALLDVESEDAFGNPVLSRVFDAARGDVMIAMHETARLPARPGPASAIRASSRGTGLALRRVLDRFPERPVVVFVGGTASTDGGAGAAQAAGWRLLDAAGRDLPPGGGALRGLRRIEPPAAPIGGSVVAAHDVDAPLLGPLGASALFAPQKGAGPAEQRVLEEGLAALAERVRSDLGIDAATAPGSGAGGGMGAGLAAFFGARLTPAFDLIAEATSLAEDVAWAGAVITGEGLVDEGTMRGKVVSRVAELCARQGRPCGVVAGEVRLRAEHLPPHQALRVASVRDLVGPCGRARAFADPAACIREVTANLLSSLPPGG